KHIRAVSGDLQCRTFARHENISYGVSHQFIVEIAGAQRCGFQSAAVEDLQRTSGHHEEAVIHPARRVAGDDEMTCAAAILYAHALVVDDNAGGRRNGMHLTAVAHIDFTRPSLNVGVIDVDV